MGVVLVALWAMARPNDIAAEWMQGVIGVLLVVAPVLFSHTQRTTAACNAYVVSAIVVGLALWSTRVVLRGRSREGQGSAGGGHHERCLIADRVGGAHGDA